MLINAILALSGCCVGLSLVALSWLQNPEAPCGVRVPRSRIDDPLIAEQKRAYQWRAWILTGIGTVAGWLSGYYIPLTVIVPLLLVAAGVWNVRISGAPIREAKEKQGWFRGVDTAVEAPVARNSTGENEHGHDFGTSIPTAAVGWWCYIAAALSIVASLGIVAAYWSDIPDVVPTHWGPNLEPDAWSDKSITSAFGISIVNVLVLLTGVAIGGVLEIAQPKSRDVTGELSKVRAAAHARIAHVSLSMIVSMCCLAVSTMQVTSVVPAFQRYDPWSFFFVLGASLGASLVAVTYAALTMAKINGALRSSPAAKRSPEAPDMEKHYKWGMFYYNPDDPTVLVEKRYGVGVDFNYATWQGKTFVVVVLAIIIGCSALPFIVS